MTSSSAFHLGPVLFIIYINDLPETVESMVHIFADDTKIYRKMATEIDCVDLQNDLDILQELLNKWLVRFNKWQQMQGYEIRRAPPRVFL